MKKASTKVAMLVFGIAMTIGVASCETTPKNLQQETTAETRKVVDFTTIEGVKSGIEGTIWTYTEPVHNDYSNPYGNWMYWIKVEFKGGKAYLYKALPSDGAWKLEWTDNYSVEEDRYIDTGEKYVRVSLSAKYHTYLVPKTGQLSYLGGRQVCEMKQKDYSWD